MSTNGNKTKEVKQTFSPKIKFHDLEKIADPHIEIESDAFYALVETIAAQCKPSFQDQYESKWSYFYLPLKRDGKLICTAVSLFLDYKKRFHVTFVDIARYGGVTINKGANPVPEDYQLIFAEISRFLPLVQAQGVALIEALYPYAWRSGRIKRKYVVEPSRLIAKTEGEALLAAYQKHVDKGLTIRAISLNDYLQTAEICYRSAFAEDIKKLLRQMDASEITPARLHKQWADGRHGGMLLLKDPDSTQEFMAWYLGRKWEGAHPFEIVYSGNVHGITLYPPDEDELHYRLTVTDPWYNDAFLKMVAALIENNVPFIVYSLNEIVDYCVGEAYLPVNSMSMREMPFRYNHTPAEKKQYFSHIEWDALQMLE